MSCSRKAKVLFLCTGNSCRSQMAEGWARHLKGDRVEAYSAGIEARGLARTCRSREERLICYRLVRDEIRTFVEAPPEALSQPAPQQGAQSQ